jgi:CheY-like chemotaxis protein
MQNCTREQTLTKKRSLLVIDDDLTVCTIVAAMAGRVFQVATVATRDGAIPLLERNFDLILMDCQMPGMGADEFVKLQRRDAPSSQLVLMSGCFDDHEASRLGIHYFLAKPFTLPDMMTLLTGLIPEPEKSVQN